MNYSPRKTESFDVKVPESILADLRNRLHQTRWPGEIQESGWDYGSNLSYVKELCEYWETEYNWRQHESRINSFNNLVTDIAGLNIHFIYEKGKGPSPVPLVITHGWPSTFAEMLDVIPMLTDPVSYGGDAKDSFDVVVPSLPGYGFSGKPAKKGMDVRNVASIWSELMKDVLGYEWFVAQGGDWGASVTTALAANYPELTKGIHLTMGVAATDVPDGEILTENEKKFLDHRKWWQENEGAYGHLHRTKPQTLSYGLNDSPAGLAAWIVEKWRSWSDCDGDLESRFSKDQLLTHITIYWVTQTIESSIRLYYESAHSSPLVEWGEKINVPTAFASFPVEISYPPEEWLRKFFDLRRFTKMPSGGHFSATEEPLKLVEDIRDSFRFLR